MKEGNINPTEEISCSRRPFLITRRRFTKLEVALIIVSLLLLVAVILTATILTLPKTEELREKGLSNPEDAIQALARK